MRGNLYEYYFCQQKKYGKLGKTTTCGKIEREFTTLLQAVQPTPTLFQIVASMFKAAWDKQGEILAATETNNAPKKSLLSRKTLMRLC
jgi:hypothetical protein